MSGVAQLSSAARGEPRPSRAVVNSLTRGMTFGVLGGSPATGNLGVSALGMATASELRRAFPEGHVILQNTTREPRQVDLQAGELSHAVELMFLHESQRLKATSGTRHVALLQRMARWMPMRLQAQAAQINRTLDQILRCDAILDLSSGDSFSDIYGWEQFRAQLALKEFALGLGKPLVLLPQTYGPFHDPRAARMVASVLRRATLAATREAGGLDELRGLLGDDFTPPSIVACPDVAFSLEPVAVDAAREPFLASLPSTRPLVGVNVSGLLYSSKLDFSLEAFDYREFLDRFIRWAINEAGCNVLLVPHVVPGWKKVSPSTDPLTDHRDSEACTEVYERCLPAYPGRIGRIMGSYDAAQIKSLIGRCDFFVGARMHACIAAISQAVPTAVLAYSKKAQGVMSLVGAQHCVVDPRETSLDDCLAAVRGLFTRRDEIRRELTVEMPHVRAQIGEFFTTCLRSRLQSVGLVG